MNIFTETYILPRMIANKVTFPEITSIIMSYDLYIIAYKIDCVDVTNGQETIDGIPINVNKEMEGEKLLLVGQPI